MHKDIITSYGYILEYCPGHPFPADNSNKGTRVRQHRLVVERNYQLFDEKFFFDIDGKKYLKPQYDVHHINFDRQDNRVENLQIMSRSEHSSLHNKNKIIIRNCKGQIIGVAKLGKNGEPCDGNTVLTNHIAQG